MNYQLSPQTANVKLGFMAASISSKETCPDACPLKKEGCYGAYGPINWVWTKVSKGTIGKSFGELLTSLKALPKGYAFRHNQVGDLMGLNNEIDTPKLRELTAAVKHLVAWTYTHKPIVQSDSVALANRKAIQEANQNGFTINISTNNIAEVDAALALGIAPVCTILPLGAANTSYTANGAKVIKCPAQYRDNITCNSCRLCAVSNRSVVVGFEAHGAKTKQVSAAAA